LDWKAGISTVRKEVDVRTLQRQEQRLDAIYTHTGRLAGQTSALQAEVATEVIAVGPRLIDFKANGLSASVESAFQNDHAASAPCLTVPHTMP